MGRVRSLGVILALALAGLQLLAIAIIVSSTYLTSERALLDHARNLLTDVGTNVIAHSQGFLSPARSAAEVSTTLAENQVVRQEQKVLLERLLFRQLRAAPQFAGAYYGDEHGNFIYVKREADDQFQTKIIDVEREIPTELIWRSPDFQRLRDAPDPDDTYDPRKRVWYQKASDEKDSIWTEPYIFFTSQSPGITAAAPVLRPDTSVQGVIGVDIEISSISNFLGQLKIGSNGSAFILDQNDDVIAHPSPDLLRERAADGSLRFPNIAEIDDPRARAAAASRTAEHRSSPQHSNFEYMGARYVSLVMPFDVEGIPWTIVVYAPENDFIGAIIENRTQNALIALAVALATGLAGLALANRINKPVRAFAVRSALISQGELDPAEPMPATYKELEHANETLVHEISQRRRTESEYRLTFDMASRGMVHIDAEQGRILTLNQRFSEIIGQAPEELEGRKFKTVLAATDPEFEDELVQHLAAREPFGIDGPAKRASGEPMWISVNGIFVQDEGDGPDYMVITIDDISQGKADEQRIEDLSREVAQYSRQTMMGEMATGLAHELNQPLTAITQNIDAAMSLARSTNDGTYEMESILREIDGQAHQAADIIRALRGFVRKDDNAATVFDMRQLLVHARRLVRVEARQHGIEIALPQMGETEVAAVRVQVAQVVVNLLRNAIDSIADGNSEKRLIRIEMKRVDDMVEIAVCDSGPGVPQEIEPFTAFETTKPDGMGLGLSISRSLVSSNGGTLWYDRDASEPCFRFTLRSAE